MSITISNLEPDNLPQLAESKINNNTGNNINNTEMKEDFVELEEYVLDNYIKIFGYNIEKGAAIEGETREQILPILLNNNGINDITLDDIDYMWNGEWNDSNHIFLKLKSGDVLYFDENDQYRIDYIHLANEQFLHFDNDLSNDKKEELQKNTLLKDEKDILGGLNIPNSNKYIYWTEDVDLKKFLTYSNQLMDAIEMMPDEIIDPILNNNAFNGFFVVDVNNVDFNSNWGAFAHNMYDSHYIFIQNTDLEGLIHEIAHIYDGLIKKIDNKSFSESNQNALEMYDKYNVEFHEKLGFPNGPAPNTVEFFANVIMKYVSEPDKLKNELPELYEFIEKTITN